MEIRKKITEKTTESEQVVFEEVKERVSAFTIEQIDAEIKSYQDRITELEEKKASAVALK